MDPSMPAKHPVEKIKSNVHELVLRSKYNPVTFVWGPPGTGKTYTLARVAANKYFQKKRVLILSHSNQAVNVLISEISHFIAAFGLNDKVQDPWSSCYLTWSPWGCISLYQLWATLPCPNWDTNNWSQHWLWNTNFLMPALIWAISSEVPCQDLPWIVTKTLCHFRIPPEEMFLCLCWTPPHVTYSHHTQWFF